MTKLDAVVTNSQTDVDLAYSSHHMRNQSEAQEHFEPSGSKKCTVNLLEHGRATWQHGRPYGKLTDHQEDTVRKLHATFTMRTSAPFVTSPPKKACAISSTRGTDGIEPVRK